MIKKNIVLSVIMGVAITLLLTSTNLAQADPTGDIVFITVVDILVTPEQTVVAVVDDGGLEAFFFLLGDPLFPLGVDIDDDSVRIEMPFGIPIPIQFSVHIDDIDWLDESGQEVPGSIEVVSCEGFVLDFPIGPVSVNWMNDEDGSAIWIFLDPIFPPGFPASIHCIYTVVHIGPPIVFVEIDIKPGSDPNSINPRSMGVVPVAILGSDSFDVIQVDVTTLAFGPNGASPAHDLTDPDTLAGHIEDVNDDGFLDLVSHYNQKQTGLACGDTDATLTGALLDGTPFDGTDSVRMVPCK